MQMFSGQKQKKKKPGWEKKQLFNSIIYLILFQTTKMYRILLD